MPCSETMQLLNLVLMEGRLSSSMKCHFMGLHHRMHGVQVAYPWSEREPEALLGWHAHPGCQGQTEGH